MKLREVVTKINDAIRPPHVGSLPPTDVTGRGGTVNSKPMLTQSQQDKRPS